MMKLPILAAGLAAALATLPAPPATTTATVTRSAAAVEGQSPYDLDIREHVFDNGLRLLVLERPGDPRVACKIFTDMGGLNETPGQAGAAHYLEHLMFKGTETLGTTNWTAEEPLREQIDEAEGELVAALNEARNQIVERGVFPRLPPHRHDAPHRGGPRADPPARVGRGGPWRRRRHDPLVPGLRWHRADRHHRAGST